MPHSETGEPPAERWQRLLATTEVRHADPVLLDEVLRLRAGRKVNAKTSTVEVCVCELTDAFAVSGPTISHHLRVLRETGLVDCERRGTWVYYRARPESLRQLSALLEIGVPAGV